MLEDNYELSYYDRASTIYTKDMLIVPVPESGEPTPQKTPPGLYNRSIPDMEDPQ